METVVFNCNYKTIKVCSQFLFFISHLLVNGQPARLMQWAPPPRWWALIKEHHTSTRNANGTLLQRSLHILCHYTNNNITTNKRPHTQITHPSNKQHVYISRKVCAIPQILKTLCHFILL